MTLSLPLSMSYRVALLLASTASLAVVSLLNLMMMRLMAMMIAVMMMMTLTSRNQPAIDRIPNTGF